MKNEKTPTSKFIRKNFFHLLYSDLGVFILCVPLTTYLQLNYKVVSKCRQLHQNHKESTA